MATKLVRRRGAVHVTYVSSDSEDGKEYQIARLPDGRFWCACLGCAFNHGKCHHLDAYHAGEAAHLFGHGEGASSLKAKAVVRQKNRVPVEREVTYTFNRRGIVFDAADIPTGRTP